MNKRAFAYARKSKEDKDDPKWSIPTQIERVRESAERRGETFAGAFEDRDVSGARPFADRPGWTALEAELQPGDVVIVNDLSRFARDTDMAKHKLSDLAARDIEVVALGIEGIDRKSADGRMLLGIFLEFTEWQRQKTIENLLQVHKRIHNEGKALGCRPPMGYDYDIETKAWSVNEDEAELVRRIFALKVAGYGYQAIALKLQREGIPTKRGGKWSTNQIKRIITNRWYIGEREYRGEVKPLHVPPLIERETWEMAQASIRTQVHQPRSTYVLSGLLRCTCGATMQRVRVWTNGHANGQADWRCPECGLSIREHIAEPAIVESFMEHVDQERYKAALTEAQKKAKKGQGRVATLKKRLAAVERKQSRLLNEFAKDDSSVTRETLCRMNAGLQGEIDDLTAAVQEIDDRVLLERRPRALGNIREDWNTLDVLDKQATLRGFIAQVTVQSQNGIRGADRLAVTWR